MDVKGFIIVAIADTLAIALLFVAIAYFGGFA